MKKKGSSKRSFSAKRLLCVALTSFMLVVASLSYFLFLADDQINDNPYASSGIQKFIDLTTITKKQLWTNKTDGKLYFEKSIEQKFTAKTNNLGIIGVAFDLKEGLGQQNLAFRIKELESKDWHYENIYNSKQFLNNIPYPFGFPIIDTSKNKSYLFQIESLSESKDQISISRENNYFLSKYKYSKRELGNPKTILQFLLIKTQTRFELLTLDKLTLTLLFGLFPFIFYHFKYVEKIGLKKVIVYVKNEFLRIKKINNRKSIFYLATFFGILLFFITGLFTRGSNHFNLFFVPSQNDQFMDFFNVLRSLFDGPYATHHSIYPPLAILVYKVLIRSIPYDIAGMAAPVIRSTQSGTMAFLFYSLVTLVTFFALVMETKRGSRFEKYLFIFVIIFSAPFLFMFERANVIFIALLFSMVFIFFKDSKSKIIREVSFISLAMSAGIKLYPALFGLLLIKEKRYRDMVRLSIYCLISFIFPFFFIGGISQLPILVKSYFSTSDETTKWGFGYMTNIQNTVRVCFGFMGNFNNVPILVGKIISFVFLLMGIFSIFLKKSEWKTIAILTLLMILVPSISYEYALIFMLIPLILFLDQEKKEKFDKFYIICFVLIFVPLSFGGIDFLNNHFRQVQFLPITYEVLIQNIVMLAMLVVLIFEKFFKKIFNIIQKLLKKAIQKLANNSNKLYLMIPVLTILTYNLIYFNKYYPITEGWFSTYAWLINHGQFPYKDFYFFLTPLYLITMSIFMKLFGYSILYLRIFGIGIILLLTYFLYKNIEIIFGTTIAAFVTVVGMIYYQSGVAHVAYDFTQFVALYGLIQSYFLLKYVNCLNAKKNAKIRWVFLGGVFAGLTFLTKQSNGLMMATIPLVGLLFLVFSKRKNKFLKIGAYYLLGLAAPVIVISFWLLSNAAFSQFENQVFFNAISAKGGLSQIFFGWIMAMWNPNFIIRLVEILFIITIFGYWKYLFKKTKETKNNVSNLIMVFASLIMFFLVIFSLSGRVTKLSLLSEFGASGIGNITIAAISISIVIIITAVVFSLLKKPINKSLVLLSFVSLGFIYGNGTSAGLGENGAFIGFCLFVALLMKYKSFFNLGKIFIIIFCIGLSLQYIEIKYERPYYWWNVTSPDIRSNLYTTNKLSILHGLYTSSDNIKLLEEVSEEIKTSSTADDSILTFPNIPIFYLLTNRFPPGKTTVHWFDFLPDQLALKEAEAIRKNPPKVVVYLDLGTSVWEAHESLFRDGNLSGQRKIVEAFTNVIKSRNMHISRKYELANNVTLTVWRQ